MGVYVKGMEMPKNCYGCPFFIQVDYWNKNDEVDILSKCKRTGEFTCESVNGYLPNCPLVAVPPHGRLIDADELEDLVYRIIASYDSAPGRMGENQRLIRAWLVSMAETIEDAPTIIEAEEGEKWRCEKSR